MPEPTVVTSRKTRLPGLDAAATPLIGVGLGLTGIVLGLRPRLAAYPLALTAVAALLYRDPQRRTPNEQETVFAPADGVVSVSEELYEHRFLHTDAVRLSINSSPFDVPVQRSPVAGVVSYVESVEGEDQVFWNRGTPEQQTRVYIGITSSWGPLLLAIYAGTLTPHIDYQVTAGQQVEAGTRLATARFGARTDLILPADVIEALPQVGESLRAGKSRVGRVIPAH